MQGHEHPLLDGSGARRDGRALHRPAAARVGAAQPLRCHAKIRYRQPDQACTVVRTGADALEVQFDEPQRTPTPGQFVVLYEGDRCLGGATIDAATPASIAIRAAG